VKTSLIDGAAGRPGRRALSARRLHFVSDGGRFTTVNLIGNADELRDIELELVGR
jgi:hypothetical protein